MTLKEFTYQLVALKDKLFRFSARIVGNDMLAEDVVQDVVSKMWDKRAQRDEYQNLEAYCMRMTKNLSIDKIRSKKEQTVELTEAEAASYTAPDPHQQLVQQDMMSKIYALIETLPLKQKLVIQLRDIEGMEYKEIAAALDLPLNQVKVNLFRARQTIKKKLLTIDAYGL